MPTSETMSKEVGAVARLLPVAGVAGWAALVAGIVAVAVGLAPHLSFSSTSDALWRQESAAPLWRSGLVAALMALVALVCTRRQAGRFALTSALVGLLVLAAGGVRYYDARHPWDSYRETLDAMAPPPDARVVGTVDAGGEGTSDPPATMRLFTTEVAPERVCGDVRATVVGLGGRRFERDARDLALRDLACAFTVDLDGREVAVTVAASSAAVEPLGLGSVGEATVDLVRTAPPATTTVLYRVRSF